MKCTSPVMITRNLDPRKFPMGLKVPCGRCMACRVSRREEWILRLTHELESWSSCIFLTLTYDDEHLPPNKSLVKRDVQLFLKKLRRAIHPRKVKYFCTGEYGDEKKRPHYHLIIFGLDYCSKEDREIIKQSWDLCDWDSLRSRPFGDVSHASIRYVVDYLEKTILGDQANDVYDKTKRARPFQLVSKGFGFEWAKKHYEELIKDTNIYVKGIPRPAPRYYTEKLSIDRSNMAKEALEKEAVIVESVIGIEATRDQIYRSCNKDEIIKVEDAWHRSDNQRDLNIKANMDIKRRRKREKF